MSDINYMMLKGRVGNCDFKTTTNGKKFITFSVACNERYQDNNQNWIDRTEWVNCVIWGDGWANNLTDPAKGVIGKGAVVRVEGKFSTSKQEKDGVTRYYSQCTADNVRVLEPSTQAQPSAVAGEQRTPPADSFNNM